MWERVLRECPTWSGSSSLCRCFVYLIYTKFLSSLYSKLGSLSYLLGSYYRHVVDQNLPLSVFRDSLKRFSPFNCLLDYDTLSLLLPWCTVIMTLLLSILLVMTGLIWLSYPTVFHEGTIHIPLTLFLAFGKGGSHCGY